MKPPRVVVVKSYRLVTTSEQLIKKLIWPLTILVCHCTSLKPLVMIGTCNVYIVHNAFLAGLQELRVEVSEFGYNAHEFFN
ncbi:hypothetical protein PR048_011571 [Dryococelus australis]|uniref:Uncharacterized protein n=1 Tax=Dryococelus australis TaxID=614101 RepID=A0ABQ9HLW3_9NEOP|nr:hypothetical protein PR048_011571 [Dryococelus australis]